LAKRIKKLILEINNSIKTKLMKNLLLFIVTALFSCTLAAQNYTFQIKQENYTSLTNATELDIPPNWDEAEDPFMITSPFPIKFFNIGPFNTIFIESYFSLAFFGTSGAVLFSAGDYDFDYRPGCSLRYKVEGNMPNRIFKVEFYQVGFWSAPSTDFFTGQIWVHENGCLSSHIGPNQTLDDAYMDSGDFSIFALNVNKFAIAAGTLDNYFYYETGIDGIFGIDEDSLIIQGKPPLNTVFEFCPTPASSVKEIAAQKDVLVYPNPFSDLVTVQNSKGRGLNRIDIVGLDGKICHSEINISGNQAQIDLSSLSKGIYLLQTYFKDGSMSVTKITRQ
jgi:hypothetical protein